MGCYYTLYHNIYAHSLLFYKVYMKRENADSWNSGLEKDQILETYSAQLQKSSKFMENYFGIYKKYWAKKVPEGTHQVAITVGACALACGPPGRPPVPIFCYMMCFDLEKNQEEAFGMKHRLLDVEPGQKQSRAPAELFCRGNFPPGGGNHHHRHHQRSSHREGVNLHQHLHQHHLLSNPNSSLLWLNDRLQY